MIDDRKISVVIVDDEPHVLEGLELLIPWKEFHVDTVKFFVDATEACSYLEHNPVDIMITDVRMPEMSGIALIEYIKEIKPAIEIIVMSGYREFDYVKQVMALGARNYLVKPIFEEDLTAVLLPAIEDIQKRRSMDYCEMAYDSALLSLYINNESQLTMNQFTVLEASLANRYFNKDAHIIGVWFDENEHDSVYESLIDIAPTLTWLYEDSVAFIILLSGGEAMKVMSLKRLYSSFKCDKMNQVTSLRILKATYEKFKNQLSMIHHYRQSEGFFFESKQNNTITVKPLKFFVADIVEAIHLGEEECLFQVFRDLIYELDNRNMSLEVYRKQLIIFYSEVLSDITSVMEHHDNKLHILPEKIAYGGLEKFITFIESKLYIMLQSAQTSREQHRDEFKYIVEKYIKDNISKPINIKDIAKVLHMHPNYMGKKLRNEFGESFSIYLNRTRIKEAISLFESNGHLTIEEVAYKVGYSSYPLFLKYFKMFHEVTPKAYVQSIKNN